MPRRGSQPPSVEELHSRALAARTGRIWLILQHSGRNRIRFTADFATFHRGKFSRRQIALGRVEEILSNDNELVLMSDDFYLTIDKPDSDTDALIQRQFVERQLAKRQTQATTKV